MGNNAVYSAKNPENSSLLTVEPGAMFVNQLRNTNSSIVNQGNLEITPGGNITLSGDRIENNGAILASGGNVFLEAVNGDINVRNIDTTDGVNGGGDINISASGGITVSGRVDASGGDFEVNELLEIVNSPLVTANSGNITLLAGDNINFNKDSRIFAIGNFGGSINIETNGGILGTDATIASISTGNTIGKGQDISVRARSISLNNNSLLRSDSINIADTGNITINADSLRLENGAQILASTSGQGNGGNLTIFAGAIAAIGTDPIDGSVSGILGYVSGILALSFGEGDAGDLTINTNSLRAESGAQIGSGSFAGGNGGNLTIFARRIELIGEDPINDFRSGLYTQSEGEGSAEDLTITTIDLLISDRARVSSSIRTGIGGNINIKGNSIKLDRGIIDSASLSGQSGNININLKESLTLANGSIISAEAGVDRVSTGDGGNITIDSPLIIASPRDNEIIANAFGGSGGNININTLAIFGYPQFLNIDASSSLGIDGNINIVGLTNEINPSTIAAQQTTLSEETRPELDDCPLDLQTTSSSQEKPIPATIGFCRTKKGTIMAY